MIRIELPTEAGNAAIKQNKLPEVIKAFHEKWHPEAAYFFPRNGKRSALFVVNVNDTTQLPALLEPFFFALHAEVEVFPAMNLEDLMKGLAAAEGELKRWV